MRCWRLRRGKLALVSVGSPGSVQWNVADPLADPVPTGFSRMGDVTLTRTQLDGSDRLGGVPSGGGRIFVRAGNLVMDASSIDSNTNGVTPGRGIDVFAAEGVVLRSGGHPHLEQFQRRRCRADHRPFRNA